MIKLPGEILSSAANSFVPPLLSLLLLALFLSVVAGLRQRTARRAQRAAYRRLELSENHYRQIVDTAHEGIWLVDTGGRILFANQCAANMLGYSVPELLGQALQQFIDCVPQSAPCSVAMEAMERYERGVINSPGDLRYRRKDGAEGWAIASSRVLRGTDGRASGVLLMGTDITQRKLEEQALGSARAALEGQIRLGTCELMEANSRLRAEVEVRKAAEQALAQSEERLQEIISMMPLPLFLKYPESRIQLMNEACEQQWGVALDEARGTVAKANFTPQQMRDFREEDQAAFELGKLVVIEREVWDAQRKEMRLVQTLKKPTYDADGKPRMMIALSVDITDYKRAEKALQLSLNQLRELADHQDTIKEEERQRIARDIHDDLGQNLMALKIDISMLHARTGASHQRLHRQLQRVLATVDDTIASVRNIINDLHPSTLELGLCAAVEWLLKQFQGRTQIAYSLSVLNDSDNVRLGKRQTSAIFRIMQESLTNIVRHASATEVQVTLDLAAGDIVIIIADNGVGMQARDRGKAASYGLKSIQERVDAFGGEFTIHGGSGGTALSIRMPVAPPDSQSNRSPARNQVQQRGHQQEMAREHDGEQERMEEPRRQARAGETTGVACTAKTAAQPSRPRNGDGSAAARRTEGRRIAVRLPG
jgi:two-component system sensor histidine kinase UhpB